MRAAALVVLTVALAGCVQMRAPGHVGPAFEPPSDSWNHQVSVRLGPRMLRVALPLLVARQSSEAPLYFRHLDRAAVSIYTADGSAASVPTADLLPRDTWEVVLRLRDDQSTITLLYATTTPALDHFYLLIDGDEERIIAYSEGDPWEIVRQALRNEL